MSRAVRRRAGAAAAIAIAAAVALTGCTTGAPATDGSATDGSAAASTPLPDIAGEWVVTRTVTESDDTSNPAHAVGAVSERFLLVDLDDCGAAVCRGTVSSGTSLEEREEGEIARNKGGFVYSFEGGLDCLDAATGGVVAVDGFAFRQEATLAIDEATGTGDAARAVGLKGSLRHTESVTQAGLDDGCVRTPPAVEVEYALTAVRAP